MSERHPIPAALIGSRAVAHKPSGKPYAYGAVPSAIRRAAAQGKDGIDLDHRTNAENHGWLHHQKWPTRRDGWTDPAGEITDRHASTDLTDAQMARLQYRGEHMMSLREGLQRCKDAGIVPCIEDKTFTGESVDYWRGVKAMADEIGVVPVIMSLPGSRSRPGTLKLKAAHDAGLVTMWLWRRGSVVPDFVDLVKSHAGRPIYRRADGPAAAQPRRRARARKPKVRLWSRRGRRLRRTNRGAWIALRGRWRRWRRTRRRK